MMTVNQVTLLGNLGADAEIKTLGNGDRVANIRIATEEGYRDRESGEWKSKTEWHRCSTFVPGIVDYLEKSGKKGLTVYVQGALKTRKFVDAGGVEKYSTEIRIEICSGITAKATQTA